MQFQIKRKFFHLLLYLLTGLVAAAQEPATEPVTPRKPFHQKGIASYYANKFAGRRTASGEPYSRKKLTAAHRTLPLGTKVKVTNLENGKWVIVRINDRGPRTKKRVIDLSLRAARHLGMVNGKGTVKVKLEEVVVVTGEPPKAQPE